MYTGSKIMRPGNSPLLFLTRKLTMYAPLILIVQGVIFFMLAIKLIIGDIEGAKTFLTPKLA
jgi:hypothetical protein